MNIIKIDQPGGPEVLVPAKSEIPKPQQGQVLIKVAAAGINRPDALQRAGKYPPPAGASEIPGLEVAGEVVEVQGNFEFPAKGDKVCALLTGGGYAEYTLASAELCLPVPSGLSMVEAAAIPETFYTVWSNVFDRAHLTAGESFLVHGGSSGIGTTAIQMVKALDARVFTTAGSEEKCQACRDLGAEIAVNYQTEDFVFEIQNATEGKGIDVILDMVAGEYINRNLRLAAEEGRIVMIAGLGGVKTEVNVMPIMIKRLTLTGSTLRSRPDEFKAKIAAKLKQTIWPFLESGKIKPVIDKTFSLNEAREAHQRLESGLHIGKLVLVI